MDRKTENQLRQEIAEVWALLDAERTGRAALIRRIEQEEQSVAVVGEPVAWVNINKHGDVTRTVSRRDNWCTTPVYRKPINSIPAADLATLRENAAMVDELRKRAERMQKALSDIAEWTDRYTTPGHPVSTIARAAIAQEGE